MLLAFLLTACASSVPDFHDASIRVVSIEVFPDGEIREDAVVKAELEYDLGDTIVEDYSKVMVVGQFHTQLPGITFDGDFPYSDYPRVTAQQGTIHYELPLSYVWEGYEVWSSTSLSDWNAPNTRDRHNRGAKEILELQRPIKVVFLLNWDVNKNRSVSIAYSDTYLINE